MTWATKCPLFDASISGGQYIKSNTANNKLVGTGSASDDIPLAYLSTDGTLADNSDVKVPTQKAVKTYADGLAITLGTGDVVGPASSVDGNIVLFSGVSGKIVKESSTAISTDGTFAGNSDVLIPTQKAVKTYADTKIASSYLDTDGTLTANSDTKVPSQKAVKTYADTKMPSSYLDTDGTLSSDSDTKVPSQKAIKTYVDATGGSYQIVSNETSSDIGISAKMNLDDTIPQNIEGGEVITQAIMPTSATNILIIIANILVSTQSAADDVIVALFQDSAANAIAVTGAHVNIDAPTAITLIHRMVAGTTSATTFKIRAGGVTQIIHVNGYTTGRLFGGVSSTSLVIMEVKP